MARRLDEKTERLLGELGFEIERWDNGREIRYDLYYQGFWWRGLKLSGVDRVVFGIRAGLLAAQEIAIELAHAEQPEGNAVVDLKRFDDRIEEILGEEASEGGTDGDT